MYIGIYVKAGKQAGIYEMSNPSMQCSPQTRDKANPSQTFAKSLAGHEEPEIQQFIIESGLLELEGCSNFPQWKYSANIFTK